MKRPLVAVAAALALSGCGKRYSIPSAAMMPTIHIGDRVAGQTLDEGGPRRGDVVVYEFQSSDGANSPLWRGRGNNALDGNEFIKRVVALPGDRVRIEGDVIVLNGRQVETTRLGESTCALFGRDDDAKPQSTCPCELQRETIDGRTWTTQHYLPGCLRDMEGRWPEAENHLASTYLGAQANNPTWPDVVVPAGHVLVLGDNRDASMDGRLTGFTPLSRIRTRVASVVSNPHEPDRADLPL